MLHTDPSALLLFCCLQTYGYGEQRVHHESLRLVTLFLQEKHRANMKMHKLTTKTQKQEQALHLLKLQLLEVELRSELARYNEAVPPLPMEQDPLLRISGILRQLLSICLFVFCSPSCGFASALVEGTSVPCRQSGSPIPSVAS